MNLEIKILIITAIALGGLVLVYLLFTLFLYLMINVTLYRPQRGIPHLKYFEAEEFSDLMVEHRTLKVSSKQILDGVLVKSLTSSSNKKLIIFFHGIGAGYEAYTKEIRQLALLTGYPVLAYSLSGAGKSPGKKFAGFIDGLDEAQAIVANIQSDSRFAESQIYAIGHSLGGYITANFLTIKPQSSVRGLVVMSAPNDFPNMYGDLLSAGRFLRWLFSVYNRIQYRSRARITTVNSLIENKIPTIVIHGQLDQLVKFKTSGQKYIDASNVHHHIRAIAYRNRHHNVYLTPASEEALLVVLKQARFYQQKKYRNTPAAEEFYHTIDYAKIGQDDEEVFTLISNFVLKEQ